MEIRAIAFESELTIILKSEVFKRVWWYSMRKVHEGGIIPVHVLLT